MLAKGTSTNKTIVRLDNTKENILISNIKFFGAVEFKKNKRYTYFKFDRNKAETIANLRDTDIQGGLERLGAH